MGVEFFFRLAPGDVEFFFRLAPFDVDFFFRLAFGDVEFVFFLILIAFSTPLVLAYERIVPETINFCDTGRNYISGMPEVDECI